VDKVSSGEQRIQPLREQCHGSKSVVTA